LTLAEDFSSSRSPGVLNNLRGASWRSVFQFVRQFPRGASTSLNGLDQQLGHRVFGSCAPGGIQDSAHEWSQYYPGPVDRTWHPMSSFDRHEFAAQQLVPMGYEYVHPLASRQFDFAEAHAFGTRRAVITPSGPAKSSPAAIRCSAVGKALDIRMMPGTMRRHGPPGRQRR
jgi:hypothetical protein